ncbi:MAG: RecX family transcriptional regulator, partial [Alistipes sp.]|nr:RecX family transcriptional regulator [Alistipes sp.]
KEISEEIIREALAELDGDRLRERLDEQLKRKVRTLKAKTPYELRTKLIRYGLSLGYDYEAVLEAAQKHLNQDSEPCDEYCF